MTDDALARDLYAIRAEPRPDFTRDLDRRAADWLRPRDRRLRLPSLRVAAPIAAAAAAAAIALLVVTGGDDGRDAPGTLAVRVVPQPAEAEGLSQAAPRDSAAPTARAPALPSRVRAGDPIVVPYSVGRDSRVRVALAGRHAATDVPAGAGRLEVSTESLDPGTYALVVEIGSLPAQRTQIEILDRG